ncbi:4Fe-4S binding protein [Natranaerovirga hydrolytica]|uniref:4Fe-4S binding protein n=1 Tax=Natranaerovirga hydrolytica TaxID=680378 RepID=UPI00104AAC69
MTESAIFIDRPEKHVQINSSECVLCGECVDVCPQKVIAYCFEQNKETQKRKKRKGCSTMVEK